MLARPFDSETVSARAVCRLKCSVDANVAAGPAPAPPVAAGASGSTTRVATPGALALTAPTSREGGTIRRRSRRGRGERAGWRPRCRRRRSASRPNSGPTRAKPCNEHRGVSRVPRTRLPPSGSGRAASDGQRDLTAQACAPSSVIAPVSTLGSPTGIGERSGLGRWFGARYPPPPRARVAVPTASPDPSPLPAAFRLALPGVVVLQAGAAPRVLANPGPDPVGKPR